MQLLGFEITRATKAVPSSLAAGDRGNWWWPIIREPFSGAWQRNMEERAETVLTYHAVYSCVTLIASDVAKVRARLVELDSNGIWNEVDVPSFSPVLRKPNSYQNRIKFYEQWVVSKLLHGNTYVLKQRDQRGIVVAMYILDPTRTKALVSPDGQVYYQLNRDNLSSIQYGEYGEDGRLTVPASEIIHDTMVPLYHPLCGVSPLTACGLAASQGLSITRNSTMFFRNGSQPSGILTAPGDISDADAARLKAYWEEKFTGGNAGKVAVVGSDLKYASMTMKAVDAQLIEQLKWSAEVVCSTFHVPAYKVGVGAPPAYNNIEALDKQYYSQCLQKLFECIELCLDEGLGLTQHKEHKYGVDFDTDVDLFRMDTATLIDSEVKAVRGSLKAPNEGRKRLNLKPVKGGDSPLAQHQDYSLAALAKRDAKDDPFAAGPVAAPVPPTGSAANDDDDDPVEIAASAQLLAWQLKSLDLTACAERIEQEFDAAA